MNEIGNKASILYKYLYKIILYTETFFSTSNASKKCNRRNSYIINNDAIFGVLRAEYIERASMEFDMNHPNNCFENKIVLISNCRAQYPQVVCNYNRELQFERNGVDLYSFNIVKYYIQNK